LNDLRFHSKQKEGRKEGRKEKRREGEGVKKEESGEIWRKGTNVQSLGLIHLSDRVVIMSNSELLQKLQLMWPRI